LAKNYHEEQDLKNVKLLRERLTEMPPFMSEFFRGIQETTSSNTRLGYANDLRIFFEYLLKNEPSFKAIDIENFTLDVLDKTSPEHIENYMEFLTYHERNQIEYHNKAQGKSRKLSAVRAMFAYFYKKRKLTKNPAEVVEFPKIHEKNITRLEIDEVARLLDEVEFGEKLTERQQKFHQYTKKRDLAIVTLLLGTGIRVSECVAINMSHVDFNVAGIKITRKGGNEVVIYFGDEVYDALLDYFKEREKIIPVSGYEDALFLSMQHKRITTRAVQNLVKKYSQLITSLKNISPHKLRSTYGTNLYQETGDIYLVADVLGHKDVNTTKKHYAELEDSRRRQAAKYVKLRKD